MKYLFPILCSFFVSLSCTAQTAAPDGAKNADTAQGVQMKVEDITAQTEIESVISDADFTPWGRLIFPANSGYWSGRTLGTLRLTWYSHIDAAILKIVSGKTATSSICCRQRCISRVLISGIVVFTVLSLLCYNALVDIMDVDCRRFAQCLTVMCVVFASLMNQL